MNKSQKHNHKGGKKGIRKNGEPSDPEVREHEEDITSEQGNGKPSVFACPECHGVLWQVEEGRVSRYRCRVGHAFTVDSLKTELGAGAERALWAAMRALEEKAAMARRLSAAAKGPKNYVDRLKDQAYSDTENARLIREIIFKEA